MAPGQGVPEPIPYRGVLQQNGAPVTQQAAMEFALYAGLDAATPSWSELKPVNVVDGRFAVQLGDTTPIPQSLLDQAEIYLAATVNGQPLVGRQRLLTAPYAHRAGSAWTFRSRDITNDLVPPGTIVAFGGYTAPAGWLPCDDQPRAIAEYPALYAAIGTIWGSPGAGYFNVPDLRGRFPRGVDDGAGWDPGRTLGSPQGHATSASDLTVGGDGWHDHSSKPNSQGTVVYGVRYTGTNTEGATVNNSVNEHDVQSFWRIDGGQHAHTVESAATETRPVNVAVKYIIKY